MIGNQRHRGSPGRAALRGALAALLASLATTAAAVDFPHGDTALLANSCQDCHVTHNATLPNLQGPNQDCLSCHAANGFPVSGSWTTGNQSTMAGSGSSHNWSLSATNANAGATPPTTGGMSAHLVGGALTCGVCHDPHTQAATPFDPTAPTLAGSAGRHFVRTNNGNSDMCLDCHQTWAQSTEAERTYSATTNRSHPVGFKDAARTTPLTLAVAGSGNDRTYAQVPLDSSLKMSVVSATGGGAANTVVNLDGTRFKFATDALAGFALTAPRSRSGSRSWGSTRCGWPGRCPATWTNGHWPSNTSRARLTERGRLVFTIRAGGPKEHRAPLCRSSMALVSIVAAI